MEKLNNVPRLVDYLHIPHGALSLGGGLREAYDQQANAYNLISEYLGFQGIDDKNVIECMKLVVKLEEAKFQYISVLFALNNGQKDSCRRRKDNAC